MTALQSSPTLISLKAGPFRADILNYGATLARFRLEDRDLILGYRDLSDYVTEDDYFGALIGPVANRVTGGRVQIGDQLSQMERNEGGATCLHSGSDGLHTKDWESVDITETSATLRCALPDGHSGLPGNREITAVYQLDDTGLTLSITATSDADTVMNLAHHPYWAIDPDQANTLLTIKAEHYLPTDSMNLPTGEVTLVQGSEFDFTVARKIGENPTFDHNWCLAQSNSQTPRHVATLRARDGLQLDLDTTDVGLQVYIGSGLPELAPERCAGPWIKPYAGIALEPQGWPDATSNKAFPSTILKAGEIYQQVTRYRISTA